MYQFPIGIMLDSLRTDAAAAIQKAAELGAGGLQMYATSGEFAPENMSAQKRRELLDMVKSHGLVFFCPVRRFGARLRQRRTKPRLNRKIQTDS